MIHIEYTFDKNINIENLAKQTAINHYKKIANIENTKEINKNENGKPYFKNIKELFFNGTHTENLTTIIMSKHNVGIDAEYIKERKFLDIAKKYFTNKEYEYLKQSMKLELDFYSIWTIKESYIKMKGLKLHNIIDSVEVDLEEKIIKYKENLFFATFVVDEKYIVSICFDREDITEDKDIILYLKDFSFNLIFAYPNYPDMQILTFLS